MTIPEAIGFPPPLLGDRPWRLPVLAAGADWFALDKPAGCLIDAHPWNQDAPSLVAGLRVQAEAGKPELAPLAIEVPYGTHYLDVEATGVTLLATTKEARGRLRDVIGSSLAQFTFHFLAREAPQEDELVCDWALGEDQNIPRSAIERRLGKKSHTVFRCLKRREGMSFWEATTAFPRPQQVRVHAVANGFKICGEQLFGEVAEFSMSDIKTRLRGTAAGRIIYPGLALRLVQVSFTDQGKEYVVEAPATKQWRSLVRMLTPKED